MYSMILDKLILMWCFITFACLELMSSYVFVNVKLCFCKENINFYTFSSQGKDTHFDPSC